MCLFIAFWFIFIFSCAGFYWCYCSFLNWGERWLLSMFGVRTFHCHGFSCCEHKLCEFQPFWYEISSWSSWSSRAQVYWWLTGLNSHQACGIFLDTGKESISPHCQVDSLPPEPTGSPRILDLNSSILKYIKWYIACSAKCLL